MPYDKSNTKKMRVMIRTKVRGNSPPRKLMNKSITEISSVPTHAYLGEKAIISNHAELVLQRIFCPTLKESQSPEQGCFCAQCRKIKNRQHPSIIWISPEKDYALQDIEIIFERTRFALNTGELFFFVLENAHTLTMATANRLLKTLEEPPTGYRFILLAPNKQSLLPTIASRSFILELQSLSGQIAAKHPLLSFFTDYGQNKDPFAFEQELKKQGLNDTQSTQLLEQLIAHWAQEYKQAVVQQRPTVDEAKKRLDLFVDALKMPPQSGSSDLFWKHLFLSCTQLDC